MVAGNYHIICPDSGKGCQEDSQCGNVENLGRWSDFYCAGSWKTGYFYLYQQCFWNIESNSFSIKDRDIFWGSGTAGIRSEFFEDAKYYFPEGGVLDGDNRRRDKAGKVR